MSLIVFKILKYIIIQFVFFIYKKIINIRYIINDKNKKIIDIRNVYELTYEIRI